KNIELINSYLEAKDEEVFKHKIITNFNKLFEDNSLVNKLTFDEKISFMKWRASQPSGIAVPLSLQFSRKYRIGFCGDWFEGDGFGRIEGSILSALMLEKKIKALIK
ncbi:NAD(P)/FAD-dependent oxidoreductase, partial [Prochlorococcus sp. AH-736-K21]|nr:NAD(P)/FAD-dependent oxidoreductase [Prochlorococcus sp. AH-736-K21]